MSKNLKKTVTFTRDNRIKVKGETFTFSGDNHVKITNNAIAKDFSPEDLKIIIEENQKCDQLPYLSISAYHFDNCVFQLGVDLYNELWNKIKQTSECKEKLKLFGQILHIVQDFYSHSNWVELNLNHQTIPVWDLKMASLPYEILSGTWEYSHPHHSRYDTLVTFATHWQINKDMMDKLLSPTACRIVTGGYHKERTLFDLAMEVATHASEEELKKFKLLNNEIK